MLEQQRQQQHQQREKITIKQNVKWHNITVLYITSYRSMNCSLSLSLSLSLRVWVSVFLSWYVRMYVYTYLASAQLVLLAIASYFNVDVIGVAALF